MKNTKKKVLFVATVDSHIELFHLPYLKMFKDKGYEVHVATNTDKKIKYCDKKHKISIARSPFKICNLKAIRQLKKIVNEEHFDVIHCHTPMGGVVARLAAKKARKNGTRMIYTAHGFHFYKGAPLKNWLLFYPVEKYLAKYTDTLITINTEDFERAKKKFGKRCFDIQYVPGVGVDEKKFKKKLTKEEKHNLRKSLGLKDDDFVMICVGRLDKNKNQGLLIKVLADLLKTDKKYHLLLAGKDEINGKYNKLAKKLNIEENVHFLGNRDDIVELLNISNVALSASKREGLPVNLIEAAFCGLPIVATDCRGNRDVANCFNGTICRSSTFKEEINRVSINCAIKNENYCKTNIFSMQTIYNRLSNIYYLNKPLVSVIVPMYNVQDYIDECINSISSQTYDNIEIIIVNDGSTDDSLMHVKKYKDKRIKIITQKNGGLSSARNNGTKNATGEYILYVDSDDFLASPLAIEKMMRQILEDDADILFFRYNYYYNKRKTKPSKKIVYKNNDNVLKRYQLMIKKDALNISAWSKLVKSSIINKYNLSFEDGLFSEDIDYSLNLYSKATKISAINDILYNYRQKRKGSISNSINEKNISDLIKIINGWIVKEYSNDTVKNIFLSYIAYQYSILLALSEACNTTRDQEQWIKDNYWLLKYDLSYKVKMARITCKILGYNLGVATLKKYNALKNKGMIKI